MAKQIKFNYKEKEYILEYSRKALSQMENAGFSMDDVHKKAATNLPLMFQGAFIMHHRGVNPERIEEIYQYMKDKEKLNVSLIKMITEVYNSLFEDSKDESKNVEWEIV